MDVSSPTHTYTWAGARGTPSLAFFHSPCRRFFGMIQAHAGCRTTASDAHLTGIYRGNVHFGVVMGHRFAARPPSPAPPRVNVAAPSRRRRRAQGRPHCPTPEYPVTQTDSHQWATWGVIAPSTAKRLRFAVRARPPANPLASATRPGYCFFGRVPRVPGFPSSI